jgi:hypothetical protein
LKYENEGSIEGWAKKRGRRPWGSASEPVLGRELLQRHVRHKSGNSDGNIPGIENIT